MLTLSYHGGILSEAMLVTRSKCNYNDEVKSMQPSAQSRLFQGNSVSMDSLRI